MRKLIYITVLLIFSTLMPYTIHADSREEIEGVTVWPTFQNLVIKEGGEEIITINARNDSEKKLDMTVYFRNIRIGESPRKNVMLSEESDTLPASWLSLVESDSFKIESNETKDIKVKVDVPKSADVKGHYPAIIINFSKEGDENTITSQSEIASVIYLSVSDVLGEEDERKMFLKEFLANKKFTFTPKVFFNIQVENVGDIHFRPRGVIEVYDSKGTRQDNLVTFNDDMLYLLPQQILEEEVSWEDRTKSKFFPPIGKYKAILSMYIEEDREQIAQSEAFFYVLPARYILYALFIIVLLVLVIRYIIKRRKKYYQG